MAAGDGEGGCEVATCGSFAEESRDSASPETSRPSATHETIFKVTSSPPTQAHFVGYEGLPSDWYLRLTGEGIRMLRKQRPLTAEIPIKP
jgi:hypothetical protein